MVCAYGKLISRLIRVFFVGDEDECCKVIDRRKKNIWKYQIGLLTAQKLDTERDWHIWVERGRRRASPSNQ
jgi:hypothetical protein